MRLFRRSQAEAKITLDELEALLEEEERKYLRKLARYETKTWWPEWMKTLLGNAAFERLQRLEEEYAAS